MMFANASPANIEPAKSLANLLLKSGNVGACHISHILFGTGIFGTPSHSDLEKYQFYELLGCDSSSRLFPEKDMDSVLLSMVYEYYTTIRDPLKATLYYPHLVAHKLRLCSYLIDMDLSSQAQTLFESVTGIIKAGGKNIVYDQRTYSLMENVSQRLSLPVQDTNSLGWFGSKLGRPKFDKMLGQLDKSFSKFVTGEDEEEVNNGSHQNGIFKQLAETPAPRTLSLADISSQNQYGNKHGTQINPYGPSDAFQSDPYNYQPQILPSRSQSTVYLNNHTIDSTSVHRQGAITPANQLMKGYNSSAALQNDLYSRPVSATANRSRRSSSNKDIYDPGNDIYSLSHGKPAASYHKRHDSQSSVLVSPGKLNNINHEASVHLSEHLSPYLPPFAPNASLLHSPGLGQDSPSIYLSPSKVPIPSSLPGSRPTSRSSSIAPGLESAFSPRIIPLSRPGSSLSINQSQSLSTQHVSYSPSIPSSDHNNSLSTQKLQNSYSPTPKADNYTSPLNPYAPVKSSATTSSPSISNVYAPSSNSSPSKPNDINYNEITLGSVYGYNPNSMQASIPENTEISDFTTGAENLNKETTYNNSNYGFTDDTYRSESAENDTSENVFSPMGGSAAISPAPSATTEDVGPENTTVFTEDDFEDDLGFSNKSLKKNSEPEPEFDSSDKPLEKTEESHKKGWFSWLRSSEEKKAVQINLGEKMSLVYDPELKRYVNKNAPKESLKPTVALPPPPPSIKPSTSPPAISSNVLPTRSQSTAPSSPNSKFNNSSSISLDDLLNSAPTGSIKKSKKSARSRYVDIMSQSEMK